MNRKQIVLKMSHKISLADFTKSWLEEIEANNPSPLEKGRRFACKIVTQWLNIDDDDDNLTLCDGTADGGIDLAFLEEADNEEDTASGDTWYLIQGKYGTAFQGADTLFKESQKIIDTLEGRRPKLNSLSQGIKEKLDSFRQKAVVGRDRIVLVFATSEPLSEEQKKSMDDVQTLGQKYLGQIFKLEAVSIQTIYERLESTIEHKLKLKTTIQKTGDDLWVGTTRLVDLYEFLCSYHTKTGDLDQLFEKNVRKFLGNRKKVNKKIQATLKGEDAKSSPRYFGLYNNGITFVVKDAVKLKQRGDNLWELHDPFIVNGCQTTRSIWDVLESRLGSGGSGESQSLNDWKKEIERAVVVTKITKVDRNDQQLLRDITRHTNSQNMVSEKDFISLEDNFQMWAKEMGERYGIYLEIQRGGWDSQKARKKTSIVYKDNANAFDLLKVFAAGWLSEAGTAFGRNAAFVPGGTLFKKIMSDESADPDSGEPFGVEDFLAAYHLLSITKKCKFGRGAKEPSRRQSKYLFCSIFIHLLKWVLDRRGFRSGPRDISKTIVVLSQPEHTDCLDKFLHSVLVVIDSYFNSSNENDKSIQNEKSFQEYGNNVNGYLKWEKIGKSDEYNPNLFYKMEVEKSLLQRPNGAKKSPCDMIAEALNEKIPRKT